MVGMVRKIDSFGRIVIPKEILKKETDEKLSYEFFLDNNKVILKKCETHCIFCDSGKNLLSFNNKLVCIECIDKLTNARAASDV